MEERTKAVLEWYGMVQQEILVPVFKRPLNNEKFHNCRGMTHSKLCNNEIRDTHIVQWVHSKRGASIDEYSPRCFLISYRANENALFLHFILDL